MRRTRLVLLLTLLISIFLIFSFRNGNVPTIPANVSSQIPKWVSNPNRVTGSSFGGATISEKTDDLKTGADEGNTKAGRPGKGNGWMYVDPLIGSVEGGHVFPGATLPFGMAKAVADVVGENQGGFGSDNSKVMGFSGLHDLGVGWIPSMGNFPIMPVTECPDYDTSQCRFDRTRRDVTYLNDTVVAKPGYFSIGLENGVTADMTVSSHAVLYRFKFDVSKTQTDTPFGPVIYAGVEDLQSAHKYGMIFVDEDTGRIYGNASFNPSFGTGSYKAHFCADFSGSKVNDTGYDGRLQKPNRPEEQLVGEFSGAWTQFSSEASEIMARVGYSFISHEQACQNAEREIGDFDFDKTLSAAESAWEDKFSVIEIDPEGASEEMLTLFWTGIYRSFISPQDYTGENQLWDDSDEPYFDSWYCIWDTFRTTHPLLTLLDQDAQAKMVRSLIDIYVHEGHLPDCRMSFCKGFTQGGSNADVVLADSLLKGIFEGIDWDLGMKAVLADAEVPTREWRVEGRGGLDDWANLGYLSIDHSSGYSRSISRQVEYAYNDFCIALMAKKLRHPMADEMLRRSHNWINMFSEETSSFLPPTEERKTLAAEKDEDIDELEGEDTGFTGFLQPRLSNGSFAFQDPALCSPLLNPNGCFLDYSTAGETYEGSVWLYTMLSSPGDTSSLISTLGGDSTFVDRLDYFHDSGLLYFGDEQSFLTAYLYHYAGRPGLSGERVRSYIPSIFNTSVNGLPGNDDGGAMGAFAALTLLGLFPNAGQDVYFIIPPFFSSVSILNKQTGNTATIKAVNFDGSHGENRFIQSVKMNDKPWSRNWLRHSFFLEGGTLEVTLGPKESNWGTKEEDRPPSSGNDGSWNFLDI